MVPLRRTPTPNSCAFFNGLLADGTLSACYRVTQQGLREFRRLHGVEAADEQPEPTEKPQQRFTRKKKDPAASETTATPG